MKLSILNNEKTTINQVVGMIMLVLNCDEKQATIFAEQAHNTGAAEILEVDDFKRADEVMRLFSLIEVNVEVK